MDDGTVIEFHSVQIIEAGKDQSTAGGHEIVLQIAPGETMALTCSKESAKWAGSRLFEYVSVRVQIGGT